MPRIARMYSELKVYHIIIRGIDKQDIFLDTYDKDKFLKIIRDTKEKYNYDKNDSDFTEDFKDVSFEEYVKCYYMSDRYIKD